VLRAKLKNGQCWKARDGSIQKLPGHSGLIGELIHRESRPTKQEKEYSIFKNMAGRTILAATHKLTLEW